MAEALDRDDTEPDVGRFPAIVGLHHVRLPVADVMRSRDWYSEVLGFVPRMTEEAEESVIGVVLEHPSGLTIGLHDAPHVAEALQAFCPLALDVGSPEELERWCAHLDALGVDHSSPAEGHVGWYIEISDPNGIRIELHTNGQPSADEA